MNKIEQTFVWWMGVVEDRKDPMKIGRCRVRILGYHSEDKGEMPTDSLPWAYPAMPINSAPRETPVGPVEGSWVMGFFRDGDNAQQPVMTHNIDYGYSTFNESEKGFNDPNPLEAGRPRRPVDEDWPTLEEVNTHRLSRGEKAKTWISNNKLVKGIVTALRGRIWDEPESSYDAKYPYNTASESESGHVVEVDDTPGAERLVKRHRKGTFEEIDPEGSRVTKVVKDDYEIVYGEKRIFNQQGLDITTEGDLNIKVGGTLRFDVGKQVRIKTEETGPLGAIVLQAGVVGENTLGTSPVVVNAQMLGTNTGTPIFHGAGSPFVVPSPMPVQAVPDIASLGTAGAGREDPLDHAKNLATKAQKPDVKAIVLDHEDLNTIATTGKSAVSPPLDPAEKSIDPKQLEGSAVIDVETRIVWEDISVRYVRIGRKYIIKHNGGIPSSSWQRIGASSSADGTVFWCSEVPDSTFFVNGTNPIVRQEVPKIVETGRVHKPGTSIVDRLEVDQWDENETSSVVKSYKLSVSDMAQIKTIGQLILVLDKIYAGKTIDLGHYLGISAHQEILNRISLSTAPNGISSIAQLTVYVDGQIGLMKKAEVKTKLKREDWNKPKHNKMLLSLEEIGLIIDGGGS